MGGSSISWRASWTAASGRCISRREARCRVASSAATSSRCICRVFAEGELWPWLEGAGCLKVDERYRQLRSYHGALWQLQHIYFWTSSSFLPLESSIFTDH